jgi:RHS repeat-associated protein
MEAAKRIILLLALVVACALPASALTPSAPENRVWEKITGTLETHQEATPQVPQSHQEEAGATAENALECFLDAETGNYFYRARYYSPYLGRFISRDPLSGAEFSQGTNLYAYCENNYTDLDDPTGESWQGFLDGAGTIPVLNEITDPINAAVSISQGDWVGAGLAIGGMAPGLGEGADVLKAGRDIVKATEEAGKITKNAEHVAKGGICFAMGTLISTPDGEKKIENIRKGDVVYCYDFKKHEVVKSHVLAIYRNTTSEWQRLQFAAGDTLQCTPKHPFWIVAQHAWVEASSLKVGAVVLLENGQEGTLTKSSIRHLSKPETTYNFNVERVHDYFVGNSQILVHNSCMAGKGARSEGKDLQEKLSMDEAKAGAGKPYGGKLSDPKYDPVTGTHNKMEHNHDHGDGTSTEVHYDVNRTTGQGSGYKIKDDTNANSRGNMSP